MDKWNKIRLTLWGRVNVIKMVVSPQFSYPLMMLPVTAPPSIFNQYDTLVKEFLWEGKRPRIKLTKLFLPRDKGGLGLPGARLYYISFEMAKLALYWTGKYNLDWAIIEISLSFPFISIELLSQNSSRISNPIMLHSKEVWMKMHKMLKLSHCKQSYSSLWQNPAICVGKALVYWKSWHNHGICTLDNLYDGEVFMSYNEVLSKYNLKGEEHLWKCLQIRNCVMSLDRQTEDNHILEYLVLPPHRHRASIFYRHSVLI